MPKVEVSNAFRTGHALLNSTGGEWSTVQDDGTIIVVIQVRLTLLTMSIHVKVINLIKVLNLLTLYKV